MVCCCGSDDSPKPKPLVTTKTYESLDEDVIRVFGDETGPILIGKQASPGDGPGQGLQKGQSAADIMLMDFGGDGKKINSKVPVTVGSPVNTSNGNNTQTIPVTTSYRPKGADMSNWHNKMLNVASGEISKNILPPVVSEKKLRHNVQVQEIVSLSYY